MTRTRLPVRLYAAALRLYSDGFRRRFAPGMIQAFEWRMENARARGRLSVARLIAATAADVLLNAAADRAGHLRGLRGAADDLRISIRRMVRQPADSLVAIATLAVGVGSVSAIFAIIYAVMLTPLPFPASDRAVMLRGSIDGRPAGISYRNARDLAESVPALGALTPFAAQSVNLTGVPQPDRVRGGFVTRDFFDVVATPPALGRVWAADDDLPGGAAVAVIGHGTWMRRFGGGADVLSKSIVLNNTSFAVIGVMPKQFEFPIDEVDVWLPMIRHTGSLARGSHSFFAVGRLADGVPIDAANAAVAGAGARLAAEYAENRGLALSIEPLQASLTEDSRQPLGLLFAMVVVMLAAACVNVAGLRLGATLARAREVATRAALGAGRARLVAQVVGESVLAGLAGALAGLAIAAGALRLVVNAGGFGFYGFEHVAVDGWVAGFAIVAGMLSGAAAGLLPALHWSRMSGAAALRDGARVTSGSGGLRSALVVAQIALAVVTLTAAGLLIRSYQRLASTDPGFARERVLTLEYRLPRNKYATPASQAAFHEQVLQKVRAVPGVEAAASVRALPFSGNGSRTSYGLKPGDTAPRTARINTVSDAYFDTMGIPILRGRALDARDRANSAPVVVVSASFARRNWPGQDALAQRVYFDDAGIAADVVGVAADIRHDELTDEGLDAVYAVNAQNPGIFMTMAVKTAGEPLALADAVRAAVWSVDPDQPMWKIRSLASLVDASLARERFLLRTLVFFAASAMLLAVLATYGSVAQTVSRRRREIGLRVALGARPAAVLALVMRGALSLSATGVIIGVAAGLAVAPGLRAFLYGIEPADPITFGGTCLLLMTASLLACWVPARRALDVDPAVALRDS